MPPSKPTPQNRPEKIPEAEQDVLASLLRNGGQTARELRESLAELRPMSHSAISTLLTRLQEKGLVTRKKGSVGKAFVFRAASQSGGVYRQILEPLVNRLFGGDISVLVSSLCEAAPPTPEQLDRMESLIEEYRGKKKSSNKGRK